MPVLPGTCCLRKLAANALRMAGHTNIAATLRALHHEPETVRRRAGL